MKRERVGTIRTKWHATLEDFDAALENGVRGEPVWFIPKNRRAEGELAYLRAHQVRYTILVSDIAELIPEAIEVHCLDIGTNHFCIMLSQVFNMCLSTLDLNDDWQEPCTRAGIPLHVCDLTADEMPFGNDCFDLVLFAEVLEHLPIHPSPVLTEFHRILKPGGTLILTTPNFASLDNRLALLRGKNPQEMIKEVDRAGSHFREYVRPECVSLLEQAGLRCLQARYDMSWDVARRRRDRLIRQLIPPFRRGMTFVARNLDGHSADATDMC